MKIVNHNPARFKVGNMANVAVRYPIGHYRVPMYLRGKRVQIVRVLGLYINPEEEAYIVVNDSTANQRYMVLPLRPKGTERFSEEQLEALVTRDAMIGVKVLYN